MAQPDLTSFQRRGLMLALRASADTPAVPTPALHGVMLLNGQSGTEIDVIERPIDRPFYGGAPFGVANRRAFIEGEIELYPPATPGQSTGSNIDAHAILLPAGFTTVKSQTGKTTRYSPVSENIAISDAYFHHAGTLKKVAGARHTLSGVTLEIGKLFKANVRVQGDYEDVEEASMPNITLPPAEPVSAQAGNTSTLITVLPGSSALTVWAKSLVLDTGNQITPREYTSHRETGITARQPTWTLRLARTSLADFNPWAVRDAGTALTVALRLKQAGNLYSELGIRGQIEQVNEVDMDGDYGWELSGRCIPSSNGGDEFYIEFGDTTP